MLQAELAGSVREGAFFVGKSKMRCARVRQQDREDQTTPLIGKSDLCLRSPQKSTDCLGTLFTYAHENNKNNF